MVSIKTGYQELLFFLTQIKVLEAQRDKNLYNQKTILEAEHKKVVGTVKSAMERTHSNEIKKIHDSYEKEIDTVKCGKGSVNFIGVITLNIVNPSRPDPGRRNKIN